MSDNKVSLHRVIKASPEKVYRAFIEPAAIASWMPPYGFLGIVHDMDVKVGGAYRTENFAGKHTCCHTRRNVLSRMAGIVEKTH